MPLPRQVSWKPVCPLCNPQRSLIPSRERFLGSCPTLPPPVLPDCTHNCFSTPGTPGTSLKEIRRVCGYKLDGFKKKDMSSFTILGARSSKQKTQGVHKAWPTPETWGKNLFLQLPVAAGITWLVATVESHPKVTSVRSCTKAMEVEPRTKVTSETDWAPL